MDYTEAEDDDICTSFEKLLRAIHTETKVLSCVSQLRSLPPNDKLTGKIFDIERAVREIEKNLEEYDDFLSSEMKTCDLLEKEIIMMAEQQASKIQIMRDSVPQLLKDAVASSRTVVVCNKAQPAVVECPGLVTIQELENVPKSTRSRLTVGVINGALTVLQQLQKEKAKVLLMNKKKMTKLQMKTYENFIAMRHTDHGDLIFLSEAEIRASLIFEAGESSAKATLHTLRALSRIKLIRSTADNTYILT